MSFVPYVGGRRLAWCLAVGVALVQFWPEWHMVVLVAGIFVFGQLVEGQHPSAQARGAAASACYPVWLMFALLAFGSLFRLRRAADRRAGGSRGGRAGALSRYRDT